MIKTKEKSHAPKSCGKVRKVTQVMSIGEFENECDKAQKSLTIFIFTIMTPKSHRMYQENKLVVQK